LLVGMLTPAMRATALTPLAGGGTCRPMLIGSDQANDNATPSPFPWGRHRSHVSKLDARLINVFNPRSSTSHPPGARGPPTAPAGPPRPPPPRRSCVPASPPPPFACLRPWLPCPWRPSL